MTSPPESRPRLNGLADAFCISEAEWLIAEEGARALIGVYNSSVATSATEVTERLGVPILLNSGIADSLTQRGFQYTFRLISKAEFYGRDQIRFLLDLKALAGYPVKRVALLHENAAFGTSAALAQKRAIMRAGLGLAAEAGYRAVGATDLSGEVARVLNARPDAIIATPYTEDSILIVRALKKAGAEVPPNTALPSERLAFDPSGQNKYATLFVAQVQNGVLAPVWPKPYATASLKWGVASSGEGPPPKARKRPLKGENGSLL